MFDLWPALGVSRPLQYVYIIDYNAVFILCIGLNKILIDRSIVFAAEMGGFRDTESKHSIAINPVLHNDYAQYSQASGRQSRANDFAL